MTAKKAKRDAEAKLLADCKTELNVDKITSVKKDEDGACIILSCEKDYMVSEDKKYCMKKAENTDEQDCIETVKKENNHVKKAVTINKLCTITECDDGFKLDEQGKNCIEKS